MNPDPYRDQSRRRFLLIGGLTLLVFILIITIMLLSRAANTKDTDHTVSIYKDPVSGESLYSQKGLEPTTETDPTNVPIFAGFSALIDQGITTNQLAGLQQAFQAYKPFASNNVEISLAVKDIVVLSPSSTDPQYRWSILSHVVVNRQTSYRIKFYYWGTSSVELFIYDSTGQKKLFDSGQIQGIS